MVAEEMIRQHQPKIAIMDENNRIAQMISYEPEATVL